MDVAQVVSLWTLDHTVPSAIRWKLAPYGHRDKQAIDAVGEVAYPTGFWVSRAGEDLALLYVWRRRSGLRKDHASFISNVCPLSSMVIPSGAIKVHGIQVRRDALSRV